MKKTELNLMDTVFSQKSATLNTNEPLNQVNSIFNATVLPLSKTESKIKLANNRIERLTAPKQPKKDDRFAKDKKLKSVKQSSRRKSAISIGISLLLMVVLAGVSIPILGTLTASIGLIGIFILDLIISRSIFKYHKDENHKLSKTTGI